MGLSLGDGRPPVAWRPLPLEQELGPLDVPVPDPRQDRPGRSFRPLFAGRVREFRGDLDGPGGAKAAYLAARPSRRAMNAAVASAARAAGCSHYPRAVRMKEDATYWLGLADAGEGEDEAACRLSRADDARRRRPTVAGPTRPGSTWPRPWSVSAATPRPPPCLRRGWLAAAVRQPPAAPTGSRRRRLRAARLEDPAPSRANQRAAEPGCAPEPHGRDRLRGSR